MTESIVLNIDPLLLVRIRRMATAKGWSEQQALAHLLEHGLFACEAELAARFDDSDADALQAAIAALEQIQDDPGFANIGRIEGSGAIDATEAAPAAWPPAPTRPAD
ncbi:MAG: hypothetical protein ACREPV_12005 [Lysobacter sp.]